MVTKADRVAIRFVTANVADKIESTLSDLGKARLYLDFDILHGLLSKLSAETRMTNPEISTEAKKLSDVFAFAHKYMKDRVLDAVQNTRDLLETAVF